MPDKSILIVDDDGAFRRVLEKQLRRQGYVCFQAASAAEARPCLDREKIDLVLCDIQMPGESGMAFIRWAKEARPDLGVLMVTGIDDPQEAQIALELGVYGYLIKPFTGNQVLICVRNALRRRELEDLERSYREKLERQVREKTRDLELIIRLLREGETQYRDLVEGSIQGILIHRDLQPLFVNKTFADLHGYSKAELLRLGSILEIIAPAERERLLGYREARLKGRKAPVHYEYQGLRKDGGLIWLESRATVVQFDGATAIQLTVADITARKQNEAALRESEERFRAISDSAQDAIIMMDPEGRISYWNKAAQVIFGYSIAEARGRNLHRFIVPESFRAAHEKAFEVFKETGRGQAVGRTLELRAVRKDGAEFPVELSLSAVNMKGGWQGIGILRDITSRKEATESLRRSHQEMEAVVSGISSILIGLSDDQRIILWNRQAEETLGVPREEVLGAFLGERRLPWDQGRLLPEIERCRASRRPLRVDDVYFRRSNGEQGVLGITLNPILYEKGRLPGVVLMGADVTHKRVLEMQQSQARKLEAIGQLAAGIAHEINTPIQYVGDNTRFLQGAFDDLFGLLRLYDDWLSVFGGGEDDPEVRDRITEEIRRIDLPYLEEEVPLAVAQTLEGVERVRRIVLSMKEFSHPGANSKTPVDINRALENTITVARNEWKYVADLETDLDPGLPPVPCIPGEINQVFLNILVNAAQAIGGALPEGSGLKGLIRIQTRPVNGDAEIRITDNGPGIPPALRERIFDPFFTTKEPGKGTGQGLAIAHSAVVKKHQGKLLLESEEGKGTDFIIRLPLLAPETKTP